jgi:putative phage-type endonuclease
MEIIKSCIQGSEEWHSQRLGSIGGSSIATAVSSGKTRQTLLYRMVAEILSGEKTQWYVNEHMLRGIEREPKARELYEFMTDTVVEQVALVKGGPHRHYSPDGLVGAKGLIEIKCPLPATHCETILANKIPAQYRRQCQWGLFICEREWVDFVSYSPEIDDNPLLVIRAERDEKLIEELDTKATIFISEMVAAVDKIKAA